MTASFDCPSCHATGTLPPQVPGTFPSCPRCAAPLIRPATVADTVNRPPMGLHHSVATTGLQRTYETLEVDEARRDPARHFGHFVIVSELGKGGMGAVYKAWNENLRRLVALKLVLGETDTQATLQRFQREAHAIARLRHPNIVAIHEVGEFGGKAFLAMDYVEGVSLDKRLGKADGKGTKKLPLAKGVEIIREVARAVQYAHEQGVIHRDLKPQNIMLDGKDHPFILDFGLAKFDDGAGALLTKEGAVMGTPAYMPPEQTDMGKEAVTARSDVYSLGATLYHVVAGRPPFSGTDYHVITQLLTKEALPPSTFNRRAAGDLDTICQKCLEKPPAKRYATAGDLADELDRYLVGDPIQTRPLGLAGRSVRAIKRNKGMILGVVLATLVTAGALSYPLLRPRLEKQRHDELLAKATAAVNEKASDIYDGARASIETVERALDGFDEKRTLVEKALDDPVPQAQPYLTPLGRTFTALDDAASFAAALEKAGLAVGEGEVASKDLVASIESAVASPARASLAARAARDRARIFGRGEDKTGRDAARERALAYRRDPYGEEGGKGFIEIAEGLSRAHDFVRARPLFATIAQRDVGPALLARAALGSARCALGLGEAERALETLEQARARGVFDEKTGAEARWLEAVAGRFTNPVSVAHSGGRIEDFGLVVHRFAEGIGPPDIFAVQVGRILHYRLDAAGRELELKAGIASEGAFSIAVARTPGGDRLVVGCDRSPPVLEVYHWEGDGLKLETTLGFPANMKKASRARVLCAGDLHGTGHDDLVVCVRPEGGGDSTAFVVTEPFGKLAYEPIQGIKPTWTYSAVAADVDGCGKNELVLATGEWQAFSFGVWKESDGRFVPAFPERRLGKTLGLTTYREGNHDEVLAAAYRDDGSEAAFQDREDLHPELPTGVWKYSWPDSLGILHARPFEERNRWTMFLPSRTLGMIPGYPRSLAVVEHGGLGDSQHSLLLFADLGSPPVAVNPGFVVTMLAAADLDGCGVPELIYGSIADPRLVVSGFKSRAAASRVHAVAPSDPVVVTDLDIGLDLLACGQADEAETQIRALLARKGLPAIERVPARLALADVLALKGSYDKAREACLDLAAADPRAAKTARIRAENFAETSRDWPAALKDLDYLRGFEHLSEDESVEVDRRLRRLTPFTGMKELLRIDADALRLGKPTVNGEITRDTELPARIVGPLGLRRSKDGIVLRESMPNGPPRKSALAIPIRFDGSSFKLKAHVYPRHVEWDTKMEIQFATTVDVVTGATEGIRININCGGGGNVSTWRRNAYVSGDGVWAGAIRIEDFLPDQPIDLEIAYMDSDARLFVTIDHGAQHSSGSGVIPRALPRGLYELQLETSESPTCLHGTFELESLTFEGQPGALRLDAPRGTDAQAELERAYQAFSFETPERARTVLDLWAANHKDAKEARFVRFLAALVSAGAPTPDDAVARFTVLAKEDPAAFEALWRDDFALLLEPEREALAVAVRDVSGLPGLSLAKRALELMKTRHWNEAAMSFLASGSDASHFKAAHAQAWEACGDYERALAALPLGSDDPQIQTRAGRYCYELGRNQEALDHFKKLDPAPAPMTEARSIMSWCQMRVDRARAAAPR